MSDTRRMREIKLIIVLAVLSVLIYSVAFEAKALTSFREKSDAEAGLIIGNDVNELSIAMDGKSYTLINQNKNWICIEEKNLAIRQTMVSEMAETMKKLQPYRRIEYKEEYSTKFGFDNPVCTIKVNQSDGEKTFFVGKLNTALDKFYFIEQGQEICYLIDWEQINKMTKSLLDLAAPPDIYSKEGAELKEFQVNGPKGTFTVRKDGDSFFLYQNGKEKREIDDAALNLFYSLKAASYDNCVEYDAKENQLSKYGLDKCTATIELQFDGEKMEFFIGQEKNGTNYLSFDDERVIFALNNEDYEDILKNCDPGNL